jgi:hypothetical protein
MTTSETKTFSSGPGNGYFEFRYPIFKKWPLKGIQSKGNEWKIFFDWPPVVEFEIAPQIVITRSIRIPREMNISAKQNRAEVFYDFVQDPSLYVSGHTFQPGEWDYLEFYGASHEVRLNFISLGEDYGFSRKISAKAIIESFHFIGTPLDQ